MQDVYDLGRFRISTETEPDEFVQVETSYDLVWASARVRDLRGLHGGRWVITDLKDNVLWDSEDALERCQAR